MCQESRCSYIRQEFSSQVTNSVRKEKMAVRAINVEVEKIEKKERKFGYTEIIEI